MLHVPKNLIFSVIIQKVFFFLFVISNLLTGSAVYGSNFFYPLSIMQFPLQFKSTSTPHLPIILCLYLHYKERKTLYRYMNELPICQRWGCQVSVPRCCFFFLSYFLSNAHEMLYMYIFKKKKKKRTGHKIVLQVVLANFQFVFISGF